MAQNFVNYNNDRNNYWRNDGPNLYTPMKGTSAVGPSVIRPSANVKNQLGINNGNSSGSGSSSPSSGSGGGYSSYAYSGGWVNPYELDLSAFQRAKDAMISSANESKGILKGQYDRLLAELAKKTEQGNEQFGQGRATISENAYDRSRANLNSLASRGLAGSGLQQLGEVQERMETGQQMNDLASQYYAYLEDLDSQRTEGEARYNDGLQNIENALQQQLAQIGLQEFQAQNEYNQYMTELALENAMRSGYSAIQNVGQASANEMADAINAADTLSWQYQNGLITEDQYKAGLTNIMGNASLTGNDLNSWSKYVQALKQNQVQPEVQTQQQQEEKYKLPEWLDFSKWSSLGGPTVKFVR